MPPPKFCRNCQIPLEGRKLKFCSPECGKADRRWAWIEKVYGLTPWQYEEILASQDYRCGCCRREFRDGETPHIDHEHGGHVRGIVCAYCNTRLIGRLKKHDLAQKLADYLKEPPAVRALGYPVIAPGRPKRKRRVGKRNGQGQARS